MQKIIKPIELLGIQSEMHANINILTLTAFIQE